MHQGSNEPYMRTIYRPYMRHAVEHAMEKQWGIPWRNNGPYYGAALEHGLEQ